ncbi:sugar phosphate isomerase/epimerase family protein [Clostridium sp. AWRP]|uniref:sugar phosphate isomerase/epimerase family protein n=1 Tax=Clostridium sp. AWRP TaxID=2212991 RepID=UPI000FDAF40F|nr:sugar phosphate isomerase/epimerase family protein [Clostridium sp. AWRP]AZV57540.1 sugar phosphate isomerase/epimerase [Clostridium sp. AWRP]
MIPVYFSSTLMWNSSLEEIFKKAYTEGFEGIEFWAQHFESRGYSEKEYKELKEIYPIKTIIHSYSWDLNMSSINERIRATSINEIFKAVDLAYNLSAEEVTVHPGKESIVCFKEYQKKLLRASLKDILEYSRKKKMKISIEIMEKIAKELITTDIELKDVLKDLYWEFTYTVDTAHCSNEYEVMHYLENIHGISKIHISNKNGNKIHIPLNQGDYDFSKLIFSLAKKNKPLVIEGFDDSNEVSVLNNDINYIKSIKEEFLCQR